MKSFNSTSTNYLTKQKCLLEENFSLEGNSMLGQGFISHRKTQEGITPSLTRYDIQDVWCWLQILICRISSSTDKGHYVMKFFHSLNVVAWNSAKMYGRSVANENRKIWLDDKLPKMSQQRLTELQQKMPWGSVSLNIIYSRTTRTLFVLIIKRWRVSAGARALI